jgi:hypothetical protein
VSFLQLSIDAFLGSGSKPLMKCPYCGVSSDGGHETQEACIEALRAEIRHVREVLNLVRAGAYPGPVVRDEEEEEEADPTEPGPSEV